MTNPGTGAQEREQWLRACADWAARAEGCDLVELVLRSPGRQPLVEVTVDRPDGVSVEDCAQITRRLARRLEEDGAPDYRIEVGSPGADRPLRSLADCQRFRGRLARFETRLPVAGRTSFRGLLVSASEQPEPRVRLRDRELDTEIDLAWEQVAWGRLDYDLPGRAAAKPRRSA